MNSTWALTFLYKSELYLSFFLDQAWYISLDGREWFPDDIFVLLEREFIAFEQGIWDSWLNQTLHVDYQVCAHKHPNDSMESSESGKSMQGLDPFLSPSNHQSLI